MLTQEEIKEKETKLYNKNKNYQLLIQTVLFSLLVYILFSPVCVSLVNKFNKRKIDPHFILASIFGIIYIIVMKCYVVN